MTLALSLEWLAFGASLLCVFCYGYSKTQGAIVGIVTAVLFITWGLAAGVAAAAATNVVFFFLHCRNLRRALYVDVRKTPRRQPGAG